MLVSQKRPLLELLHSAIIVSPLFPFRIPVGNARMPFIATSHALELILFSMHQIA